MVELPMDDDVLQHWYDRSRRIAAWAWLYHAGLVVLSGLLLHGRGDLRTRLVWAGLAGRDVVTALLWRRRVDPSALVAAAFVTDVAAGLLLRDRISSDRFRADRSMGQFGVAGSWALLLHRRQARIGGLLVLPLAQQIVYSRIWRLGRRDTIFYLAREIGWSVGSLWAVAGLREQLEDAARTEQRIADVRRETARLDEAKAAEVGVWFRFHERLSVFNNVRARAGIQSVALPPDERDGYRRIEDLAKAEHDRFRRDPALLTLNALIVRILTAQEPQDGSSWENAVDEVVELDLRLGEIRWLLQTLQRTHGPVMIRTDIQAAVVHLEIRSPGVSASSLPIGWSAVQVEGTDALRGTLARLPT